MHTTRTFFANHHLDISESKSKIMTHDSATGKTSFSDSSNIPPLTLDNVLSFKYLGIPLSCSPRCLFQYFNENVKKKAKTYLSCVLSFVKSGPDRSELAYTLWTRCALPSILYGTEVMPLTLATIAEVERCQTAVGKFILQIPSSSANCSVYLDAGLKPVWAVIAEKVILYANSTMKKDLSYWPKKAMNEHISSGSQSSYTRNLIKWKHSTNSFGLTSKMQTKASVTRAATIDVLSQQNATSLTTFAMNDPINSPTNEWFKPKSWVNDSCSSQILAQFRACNSNLGNRGPARNGKFYKLCPLCAETGSTALNNEVTGAIGH